MPRSTSEQGGGHSFLPWHEPHTGFVGRERELAELRALILEHRLLCLVGPGGVGKTRLAVELARRLEQELPVTFVALEPIRDPGKVTASIAAQAGVRELPGVTGDEALVAALGDGPRLIVLDAAEHARESVAAATAMLLEGAPALRILVTSRRAPGSTAEVCWAVPPLGCPEPGADARQLAESDAVRLFLARARERAPRLDLAAAGPELVGELCRRVGGLPLAIELIAGWTGTLSVREILDHRATLLDGEADGDADGEALGRPAGDADGRPAGDAGGESAPLDGGAGADRRQVLREVIEASYLLLDEAEQSLLPRLTVFAGPFTLQDAHTVTGIPTAELLHRVRALVDASWLHVHGDGQSNRFVLLETIRAFAARRLAKGGGEAALRERHARHFAATAAASEEGLATPDAPQWRSRLA
ncbi:MAG TPA: AAA family ATPase, partial [Actinospica sp.]|nr:AAA family ATPase [Actinospica sp.]